MTTYLSTSDAAALRGSLLTLLELAMQSPAFDSEFSPDRQLEFFALLKNL